MRFLLGALELGRDAKMDLRHRVHGTLSPFEMPLLGYGGYLPFALETYALVMLMNRLFRIWSEEYLRFDGKSARNPSEVPTDGIVRRSCRLL